MNKDNILLNKSLTQLEKECFRHPENPKDLVKFEEIRTLIQEDLCSCKSQINIIMGVEVDFPRLPIP